MICLTGRTDELPEKYSFAWTLSSSAVVPNPLPCARFCPLSVSSASPSRCKNHRGCDTHYGTASHSSQMEKGEEEEEASEDCLVQTTSEGDERAFCQPRKQKTRASWLLTPPCGLFLTHSASFGDELSVTGETLKRTTRVVLFYDPVSISTAYSEEKVKIYPHRTSAQHMAAELCKAKTRHWGAPCTAKEKSGHRLVRVVWGSLCRVCLSPNTAAYNSGNVTGQFISFLAEHWSLFAV